MPIMIFNWMAIDYGHFVNSLSAGYDHHHTALHTYARAGKEGNSAALPFPVTIPQNQTKKG
jgi:hypothetical protein